MAKRQNNQPEESRDTEGIVEKLWNFLSSTKLALGLILTVIGLSLVGVFLTNVDVFHSWIFLASGALLVINILVCSINRWPGLRLSLKGGEIKQTESFLTGNVHEEAGPFSLPVAETSEISEKVLRKHGYRVRVLREAEAVYIAADKNRFLRLGTYASHLSLVLFVLAYVLGGFLGFRDPAFSVAEGGLKEVGHNTGLSLQLNSFVDEYYPDSLPKDYRSQVTLYENGQEVKQALIRVNHPLIYKGVRFYQSSFGPAEQIQLKMNGQEVYSGNVSLDNQLVSQGIARHVGFISLEGGVQVRIIMSAGAEDTMIPEGQLAVDVLINDKPSARSLIQKNVVQSIGGFDILYQGESKFSGFQVSTDPANVLIWISSALFILGIMMVFYFPYRQVWVLSQSLKKGNSRVLLRGGVSRGTGIVSELKKMVSEIKTELPDTKNSKTREAK
jgi:cytochrome c biogenesis protein